MKKLAILFVFFFQVFFGKSQVFTNGSVFDFEVGDTLQTVENYGSLWWSSPSEMVTKIFISKIVSSDGDTVFYKYHHKFYEPASCFSCSPIIGEDTFSLTVVNPSDTFLHLNNTDSCVDILETFAFDNCGNYYWQKSPDPNSPGTGCFEGTGTTSRYSEGLGLTHYYSANGGDGFEIEIDLVFYHKMNGMTCGTLWSLEVPEKSHETINIIGNPAVNFLEFSGWNSGFEYAIYDLAGNLAIQGISESISIDISTLNNGFYLIYLKRNSDDLPSILEFIKSE